MKAQPDAARHPRPQHWTANFRLFCPSGDFPDRLGSIADVENPCFVGRTLDIDDHISTDGRVMECSASTTVRRAGSRYLLASPARHLRDVRGVPRWSRRRERCCAEMAQGHAKPALAGADAHRSASAPHRPATATTTTASAPGPGLIDVIISGEVGGAHLHAADANLPCSPSQDPASAAATTHPGDRDQWHAAPVAGLDTAIEHYRRRRVRSGSRPATTKTAAGRGPRQRYGDIPNARSIAAVWCTARPDLKVRVVNMVEPDAPVPAAYHPHSACGMNSSNCSAEWPSCSPTATAG